MKKDNVRLLVMDIDRTLVNDRKQITPKTRDALIALEKSGVRLALASGRPVCGMLRFAEELRLPEFGGILISSNGAKAETADGIVLYENPIPQKLAAEVLEHLKSFDVLPMVEDGEYMQVNNVYDNMVSVNGKAFNVMDYEAHSNGFLLKEGRDLAKSVDFSPSKILTAGTDTYLKEHAKEMAAPFTDRLDCMFTSPFYFEYTNKNTNKGAALSHLPFEKEEIAAIGDAQNDLPMFDAAGIRVAMGNAVDETKKQADYITLDNNSDGIAAWVEEFFELEPERDPIEKIR